MKKIKQIIIIYDDGSFKGYNKNAFQAVLKIKLEDYFKGEQ